MRAKHLTAAAAIAFGIGLTGLGAGVGAASADRGHDPSPCGAPYCQSGPQGDRENGRPGLGGPAAQFDQQRWDQRGFDQGRYDHQPFNYQGNQVAPYFDNDRGAWGFWFLGQWIGL
jgi:hypothetical protein